MAKGINLSRGVTIYLRFVRDCTARHEDVDLFNAPSECHKDVSDINTVMFRRVRRHIKGVTGLRWKPFIREVRRRTCAKFVYVYSFPHVSDSRPDYV